MNFLKSLFTPPPPATAVHQVTVRPVVVQPTAAEQVDFAAWRAAHIQRFLDDPANASAPQRAHLEAERDMHLAALRMRTI